MNTNTKNKNQEMLETGSFPKLLLNLCLPAVIIMLVMIVYNMADTFFIGQTGDPNQIAAVSLCAPIFSILSGLGTLFGNGGCTSISLALGKKETETIKKFTSVCCYASLFIGVLFLAAVFLAAKPISLALGANTDTLDFTLSYLRIIALGAPAVLFSNVFACIVRADGAAKESMFGNVLGTLTNILLDALFILVFRWGVAGAALATVLGNVASSLYFLSYIVKKQRSFSLHPKYFTLDRKIVVSVVTLGMPMAFGTLLMSFSSMIANRMMVSYGSVPLAAQSVAGKLGMLITMLAMGICMGMQPALSYACGRGDKKRLNSLLKKTGIFNFFVGSLLTVICFLFRNQVIAIFIDDAEVIAYGQIFVYATLATGPIYGFYQLCQTYLQSTGKASYATLTALLDKGIFYLPILLIMRSVLGMYGIAFASAVTLVFSLAAGIFFSLRWNKQMDGLYADVSNSI